jgi:protocatechuate 4,5-dioxygenase alpha chain
MGLESFDPTLAVHELIQDLKWDAGLRAEWDHDHATVWGRYALRPEERDALEAGDFRRLYELGLHPYLGGQLARLLYGNAAGPEATRAVHKLVASLRGEEGPE